MPLGTVQEYVDEARVLLQDGVVPYRYADAELLSGLNLAVYEARRLRPDIFLTTSLTASTAFSVTTYSTVDTTAVAVDIMYRVAILYYILGHAQKRDEEDVTNTRANDYMARFTAKLLSLEI